VGSIEIPGSSDREAFLWSADRGIRRLGFLADHQRSFAWDVSYGGTVVVGTSLGEEPPRAFRWTADAGMEPLAEVGEWSDAAGVSGDGRRVILNVEIEDELTPFLWDETLGARPLVDALAEHGFALRDGEGFERVTGISEDGRVLVGWGYNRRGGRGFRLTLPAP
jgi:uncharacterized membrane protein